MGKHRSSITIDGSTLSMKSLGVCLKGLWSMSRSARGRVLVSILIGLVRIAASLFWVWICKRLIDIATGVNPAPLGPNIGLMIGIMLVQLLTGVALSYWNGLNVVKTQNALRMRFFSHVLQSEWNGKEEFHSGDTINRLEEDVRVLVDLICSWMPDVVITVVQLVAASVYLLTMDASLLWLLVLLMCVAVVCSRLFFVKIRKLTRRIREGDSRVQQIFQDNLRNRILVLTLIGSDRVLSNLGYVQNDIEKTTVERLNYNAVARGLMNFGFMAGYAAAFLWGVTGIKAGTVTFGMMTAFLQLVGQVQRPIAEIGRQIPTFIKATTSIERLMELEELSGEDSSGDVLLDGALGIRFENVTFSYGKDAVIRDFSHDFKPGTMTVLAGPTGIGKSTLTRIMLGLLKPSQGSVKIYSSDGEYTAGKDTRCNFMYVPQGNSLLSGTVRENMLLARADATDEQITDALKVAAAEFVMDLPEGLDTMCGEGGSGMSEGQCQRIAVARALLHRGGVMILDESTSSLDVDTELRLLKNLSSYKGGKTIIFISHRPAAVQIADDVLTLS